MKTLRLISIILLLITASAFAGSTTYNSEPVGIYTVMDNDWTNETNPISLTWEHPAGTNPYPGDYEQALSDRIIESASLNITVDDLDFGNSTSVMFKDKDGIWHGLGYLNTMSFADEAGYYPGEGNSNPGHITTTSFALDPHWLNGVSVNTQINWENLGGVAQIEVEEAFLSVTAQTAPAPGAVILGTLGIGVVGWLRRRKAL